MTGHGSFSRVREKVPKADEGLFAAALISMTKALTSFAVESRAKRESLFFACARKSNQKKARPGALPQEPRKAAS
jgi:hypothetical protein